MPCVSLPVRRWTQQEETRLQELIELYDTNNWKLIESEHGTRTAQECKIHWSQVMNCKLKKGRWDAEEDEKLLDLIAKDLEWKVIANHMENRSEKQCKERWFGYLDPSICNKQWSAEDDRKLLELYVKYGPKWSKISKQMVGKTENGVKIRCNSIYRMIEKGKKIDHIIGMSTKTRKRKISSNIAIMAEQVVTIVNNKKRKTFVSQIAIDEKLSETLTSNQKPTSPKKDYPRPQVIPVAAAPSPPPPPNYQLQYLSNFNSQNFVPLPVTEHKNINIQFEENLTNPHGFALQQPMQVFNRPYPVTSSVSPLVLNPMAPLVYEEQVPYPLLTNSFALKNIWSQSLPISEYEYVPNGTMLNISYPQCNPLVSCLPRQSYSNQYRYQDPQYIQIQNTNSNWPESISFVPQIPNNRFF